tara:strand:+ start:1137 stop:1454 length:318 start_codon:yes stop_codon:yes gene_type:complete
MRCCVEREHRNVPSGREQGPIRHKQTRKTVREANSAPLVSLTGRHIPGNNRRTTRVLSGPMRLDQMLTEHRNVTQPKVETLPRDGMQMVRRVANQYNARMLHSCR